MCVVVSFAQVEELLTSYLKDVGITEEQFVMACEAGSTCNDQTKVADRVSKTSNQWVGWLAGQKHIQLDSSWSVIKGGFSFI
jgi:hypothetical protein